MTDNPEKILGIDPGRRRVGLAVADTFMKVATGFDAIEYESREKFLQRLQRVIDEEKITLVVVGLPRNMNGSEGPAAKDARRLADSIKKRFEIEVALMDERLTTHQAVRQIHETGDRIGKKKGRVDMLSAALILQSYLDSLPEE